ncbi:MAG: hypothetical protein ACTHMO_05555 [Rhodanobacteraceae bacterium]
MAGLPEDVREHVANMDARNTVNGSWNAIRAELLRLTRKDAILEAKNRGTLANNLCPDHRDKQTGKPCLACTIETLARQKERAEAELAALKREIAEAPIVLCEVKDGADEDDDDIGTFYMPRAYWNVPVALLPVGGEG